MLKIAARALATVIAFTAGLLALLLFVEWASR